MSIRVMSAVWDSGKLRGPALLTMLCLADFADEKARCWPSIETLAGRTRQSERNARRTVAALEKVGALRRIDRRGTSNIFEINPGFFMEGADSSVRPTPDSSVRPTPDSSVRPTPDSSGSGADTAMSAHPGHSCVRQSVIEPSREATVKARDGSAEPEAASAPATPPAVILLPLNDGTEFPITETQVEEWRQLYQATDVLRDLRNMRGWLLGNPKNRKTRAGILRFANAWLSREQNKAPAQQGGFYGKPNWNKAEQRQADNLRAFDQVCAELRVDRGPVDDPR
ncbi:MAG: helix-turn-helix domain-containing protein [Acidobacteriia bacterium]|nr:helix-turn-helix domain-containing protein [Terriglobia bacterium]